MTRPSQFTLAKLFKDVFWIALSLAVYRLIFSFEDDGFILPAIAFVTGFVFCLPFGRGGEGGFAMMFVTTILMLIYFHFDVARD